MPDSPKRQQLYQDLRRARYMAKNAMHDHTRRDYERQARLIEMELVELPL